MEFHPILSVRSWWQRLTKVAPKAPLGSPKKHLWLWGILAVLLFLVLFFFSVLGNLRVFFPYYGELTGLPFGERNYLLVFQNNHELRPGGGFISAYGILQFRSGFLTKLDVADVYGDIDEHSYQEPPYPMKQLLENPWYKGYTFRDANYNPDYPKTAGELERMIHLTKPQQQIDGVITVNYSFLEDLLGALGQIEVEGKVFSKNSLFETLEHQVNNIDKHNIEELKNRKSILKPFAQALIKKIITSPFKLRRVSDTVLHSLATKEIQLSFKNAGLKKMVTDQGWSGEWPTQLNGDFLAVNEANLGGMKSDRYIQRQVYYHVKKQENPETGKKEFIGDVTIELHHFGIENIPLSGPYTGFIRTYVPRGAKLIEVSESYRKDLWQQDHDLYHIFGNIVRLKPGEKTQLHYRYKLPEIGLQGQDADYQLFIAKQSGTTEDYYTVIVEAPQGQGIVSDIFAPRENFGIYQNELTSDLHLDLKFLPDKQPPQIIYQGIDELGKISIIFNENITDESSMDSLNYELKDLNITNAVTTDTLLIDHVEHSGKGIRIFVRGMTNQPEERYSVTLKNLSDRQGNLLDPNPRTVTVVQRFGR